MDRTTFGKLVKFCPAYEKHCVLSNMNEESVQTDLRGNIIVPPLLPKADDFIALDLPVNNEIFSSLIASVPHQTRLTAAIIASCTPDCTAAHCTDECKCAHTHPKVHAMCNPPSNAQLADTCQKWYAKCPMFQPVQY
uniref:Phlebovirus glycoprotein G2 fusion domain-containing protein n=1 Tax=Heterorhabditis bacteriophora TaxID=37862 RepID=A0A1I7XV57_HETBA